MADTLPIGYQFCPSAEQLFFFYLAHRVRGDSVFPEFIREFDVYEKEPWKFFEENAERSLYVFTKIKMKKSRVERTAGAGFWKGAKTTDIKDLQGNIVGHKKHFNFKLKDGSSSESENAAKGSWIMHEYSMLKQEIVLCKIRFKKEESGGKQSTALILTMPIRMEPSKTMSLFSGPQVDWQRWHCIRSKGDSLTLASPSCLDVSAQSVSNVRGFVNERRPIMEENIDSDGSQFFLDNIDFDWTIGCEDPEDGVTLGESSPACHATISKFVPPTVEALERSFSKDLQEYLNNALDEPN